MLAFLIAPLYLLLNLYILRHSLKWLRAWLSCFWLGLLLYGALLILFSDLTARCLSHFRKTALPGAQSNRRCALTGILLCTFLLLLCIGGVIHAQYIHTTYYEISLEKPASGQLSDTLRIVMAADFHLGKT